MRILVDADSLPARNREIIAGAAERVGCEAIFVANRALPLPEGSRNTMEIAPDADEWLAGHVAEGDLVITRDIPLAARVVEQGATAISDRGEVFTGENVTARLREREIAMEFRNAGVLRPDGVPYGQRERQAFANALDRFLAGATGERG